MSIIANSFELERFRKSLRDRRDPNKPCVSICGGTGCLAYGSESVIGAFEEEILKQGKTGQIELKRTGCLGFCERGTIVIVYPEKILYTRVQYTDAAEIIQSITTKKIVERLLYIDPTTGEKIVHEPDIPFYKNQKRILLNQNFYIDPKNIDDYIALGGYSALAKALTMLSPDQVLNEVKKANLRGRGGGGFPAGVKWETTKNAPGDPKYVIVNCDEGDPGAYMVRCIVEGNPHSVLEGLILGGYAIGSHDGFVYVRQEYPLAVENVEIAIQQAEEYGFLGRNILGSRFDFRVEIHRGAGAFVSGESSALMTAIEGRVGEPRPKYIRTSVKGLWGKPSNLNNVETWANVPLIINYGSEWFLNIGGRSSPGTKIFSLVGKVNNTGLVEVPMTVTFRDVIFKIGGGIPGGKKFKAVQTGGPSGGVIPEQFLDCTVDFDEPTKLGSMMGSGGMIVMDENSCMVDIAKYFLKFLSEESCGKCVPCREGVYQMLQILTNICEGRAKEGDIELLLELSDMLSDFALCALGTTAPNPILSSLKYFRQEYEAHIYDKKCPSLVCKALISYYIDPEKCDACLICQKKCPEKAIDGAKHTIHVIDQAKCNRCGICLDVCPSRFNAVAKIAGRKVPEALPLTDRLLARASKKLQVGGAL